MIIQLEQLLEFLSIRAVEHGGLRGAEACQGATKCLACSYVVSRSMGPGTAVFAVPIVTLDGGQHRGSYEERRHPKGTKKVYLRAILTSAVGSRTLSLV
jgi:hypothetical protein